MPRTHFRNPVWQHLLLGIGSIVFFAVSFLMIDLWSWVFFGFAFMALIALLDSLSSKIHLEDEELVYTNLLRTSRIEKETIEKVSWAYGTPVTLSLKNGKSITIQNFGRNSQSLSNSIRAWLNRRS